MMFSYYRHFRKSAGKRSLVLLHLSILSAAVFSSASSNNHHGDIGGSTEKGYFVTAGRDIAAKANPYQSNDYQRGRQGYYGAPENTADRVEVSRHSDSRGYPLLTAEASAERQLNSLHRDNPALSGQLSQQLSQQSRGGGGDSYLSTQAIMTPAGSIHYWQSSVTYLICLSLLLLFLTVILGIRARALQRRSLIYREAARQSSQNTLIKQQKAQAQLLQKDQQLIDIVREIRTPLNHVSNSINEGLTDSGRPESRSALMTGMVYARDLLQAIDQLIDLAHENALSADHNHAVDISPILRRIVEGLQPVFDARELQVSEKIEFGLIICCSREGMEKIIVSLLSTIIKHTPRQGRIDISSAKAGDTVVVSINDQGHGLVEGEHTDFFEHALQLKNASRDSYTTMGIGLTLARQLIVRFNGQFYMQTNPGVGPCFIVIFPYIDNTASTSAADAATAPLYVQREIDTLLSEYSGPGSTRYNGEFITDASAAATAETRYEAGKCPLRINDRDQVFIASLKDLVAARYGETNLSAKIICEELAISESQLRRKIKALFGQSVPDYIRSFRLQKAAELLKQEGISAAEVAYITGFSSPAYFGSCFKAHYGVTPKTYQTNHAGTA